MAPLWSRLLGPGRAAPDRPAIHHRTCCSRAERPPVLYGAPRRPEGRELDRRYCTEPHAGQKAGSCTDGTVRSPTPARRQGAGQTVLYGAPRRPEGRELDRRYCTELHGGQKAGKLDRRDSDDATLTLNCELQYREYRCSQLPKYRDYMAYEIPGSAAYGTAEL